MSDGIPGEDAIEQTLENSNDLKCVEEMLDCHAEVLKRLMIIVGNALPHTHEALSALHAEWHHIAKDILAEYHK